MSAGVAQLLRNLCQLPGDAAVTVRPPTVELKRASRCSRSSITCMINQELIYSGENNFVYSELSIFANFKVDGRLWGNHSAVRLADVVQHLRHQAGRVGVVGGGRERRPVLVTQLVQGHEVGTPSQEVRIMAVSMAAQLVA